MEKKEKIKSTLIRDLKTSEQRFKFLELIEKRMDENKKSIGSIFLALILCGFAFQLFLQTKISEINIGPFKINDTNIILLTIPTVFTFLFYKYLMVWYDFVEQKNVYKVLTSLVFEFDYDSYLNNRIKPFSLTDSINKHHSQEKFSLIGCLSYLLWVPVALIILLFPFIYEFYLVYELYRNLVTISGFYIIILITPIIIILFTILMLIKVIEKGLKENH